MKKDDTVRNLLESKFDRETIAVLLYWHEIPEILQRCNYSESFIKQQMIFKSWTQLADVMKNTSTEKEINKKLYVYEILNLKVVNF
jgi:hypothetical protein